MSWRWSLEANRSSLRLFLLSILLAFLPTLAMAEKGSDKMKADEEGIIAETQRFAEAWSRGDAKAAAAFFADDGVRVGAMGDTQRGRAELEAAYDRMLHGPFAGAKVHQERGTIRMLTAELALWQGAIEITPIAGAPMKGHVVQLMNRVEGRWLVLEAHPKLFPPPPPPRP